MPLEAAIILLILRIQNKKSSIVLMLKKFYPFSEELL